MKHVRPHPGKRDVQGMLREPGSMKRRSLLWFMLIGVLAVIGLTILVGLWTDPAVQATRHPVTPGAEWFAPRESMALPEPASPGELSAPAADLQQVPVDPESVAEVEGRIADLVRRLEEIEARRPLDYHHGAAAELKPLLSMEQTEQERALGAEEALTILDEWALTPRVRGSVLALVGAWGWQAEVLARCTDRGEAWRSAMIGLMCTDSRAGSPSEMRIELTEYLDKVPRDDVVLLPLELGRVPDGSLHALLFDVGSRGVDDLDAWHSRNLAILALGTSIDERPDTLDLMTRLLFDNSFWGGQVRLPVCFVMTQARNDESREVILEFLADSQTGDGGKIWVRWWLGDRPLLSRELEVLAAPLQDPSAGPTEKFAAVGSLLKRAAATTPDEAEIIELRLVDAVDQETDEFLRSAMIMTLAEIPGGAERFRVLEQALRTSPKMGNRLWAARGLGTVPPEFAGRARSVLLSVRPGENEPNVLAAIQEALLVLQ